MKKKVDMGKPSQIKRKKWYVNNKDALGIYSNKRKRTSHRNGSAKLPVNSSDMIKNHCFNYNSSLGTSLHTKLSENNSVHELFNRVYSGEMIPVLPSRAWSIHYVETPVRCIVISEIMIHHEIETGFIPVHTKQIVFDEKMNYELFFLNSKASITNKPYVVKTLTDMMDIIAFVNNIKLCSGGPKTTLHANVNLECAYRDPQGRWRHNLCTLEVDDNNICESCVSLLDILQRNGKRNRLSARVKDSVVTARRKDSVDTKRRKKPVL